MAVINNEYPIHYELLCQRVAPLLGNEKATIKIRNAVDASLSRIEDAYIRKGDFFFPANYKNIPIKLPNRRKIQHIHTEELAVAIYTILKTCFGTTRKAITDETARVYGFSRTGPNISVAMNEAIDYLIENGKAEELDGKLRIK